MKKGLIRSISLLIVIALCLGAIQFTTFSESASQANFKQLSEWVEMADALLEKGTTYVEGKTAFDAAYDDAVSILEAGVADAGEIDDCIDDLKTAWADLKFETVTEIAPDNGIYNDTGCEGFGSSYKTVSAKQPKINYTINATGADFWSDIQMIYLYAYGYQTDSVIEEDYVSGTTLPKGNNYADPNGIRLCTTDYANSAYPSSADGWAHRALIRRFEFSKTKLNKFITAGNVSQIMFCYNGASTTNVTLCAGSLFIVRSSYEQVPVSYELYKWVKRAENLLAQGKTYTAGLDDFNTAIDAAKSATDSDDTNELIEGIKTAWGNLVYADLIEIAPSGSIANDTGCANFGSHYKTVSGTNPTVDFTISSDTRAAINDSPEEIYIYAYGYDTAAGLISTKLYDNLYAGNTNPGTGWIRFTDSNWNNSKIPSSNSFTRNAVRKYTFSDLPPGSPIKFALGQGASASVTMVVGSLFIVKGTYSENLPSDRIFTWIDRAEALLGSGVDFVSGLDDFNTAIAALYASNDPSQEQTLVDNLRTAWNNLCYEGEPVAIGYPKKEVGNDTTASYTSEDEKLGNHYIRVESNGSTMRVRIDCITDAGFPTEWFDDVIDIFFYTRGYQTDNSNQGWSSKWTNENVNTSIYFDGPNINYALSKFTVNKEKMLNKLNGSSFRNLMITQGSLGEADTWIVGTLYASMKTKVNPADYGLADYGDLNGDETIDILDLVLAEEYIVGISDKVAAYSLDINEDDNYDESDFSLLLNIILQPI